MCGLIDNVGDCAELSFTLNLDYCIAKIVADVSCMDMAGVAFAKFLDVGYSNII